MDTAAEPPVAGISGREAAEILGLTNELSVSRLVRCGVLPKVQRGQKFGLDRDDVEQLALERYAHRDHPYWTTTGGAAEILGVTPNRVRQLAEAGRFPAVRRGDGRWYFRRHQVVVIANARESRKWRDP